MNSPLIPEHRIGRRAPVSSLFGALALIAGCASPASVEVRVMVDDKTVDGLDLLIRRGTVEVVRCHLAGGASTGNCPFESGTTRWTAGAELDFVLYGTPSTALDVQVTGSTGASAVTSTSATVTLPARAGDRADQTLALRPRTSVRHRCSVELVSPAGAFKDATALAVVDVAGDGKREILAVSPGNVSLVGYSSSPKGCALAVRGAKPIMARGTDLVCVARGGQIAVGNVAGDALPEAIVSCPLRRGMLSRQFLVSSSAARPGEDILRVPLDFDAVQLSNHVLVDLDGDGMLAVAALASLPPLPGPPVMFRDLQLLIWRPNRGETVEVLPLHGVRGFGISPYAPFGPLVIPSSGGRQALLIAGYAGGTGLYDSQGLQVFPNNSQALAAFAPAVTTVGGRLTLATFYSSPNLTEMFFSELGVADAHSWAVTLQGTIQSSALVHVAIGDLRGDGSRTAVVASGPSAYLFPVDINNKKVTVVPLVQGDGVAVGAQTVLLANIDGKPGAEILAFDPAAEQVYAVHADGTPVAGWPVQASTGGAAMRVLIDDLDRDGSAELIILAYNSLQVFSLGPGTYDSKSWPWPAPFGDGRNSSADLTENDPL